MAHDSIREQIIQNVIDTVQNIENVKSVERSHPATPTILKKIPSTQLPRIGITAGLPKPEKTLGDKMGDNDFKINSNLQIVLSFFAQHKTSPDKWISFYLDELWRELYKDQTRGGLAVLTNLEPDIEDGVESPYIGFYLIITVNYYHDTKGI